MAENIDEFPVYNSSYSYCKSWPTSMYHIAEKIEKLGKLSN